MLKSIRPSIRCRTETDRSSRQYSAPKSRELCRSVSETGLTTVAKVGYSSNRKCYLQAFRSLDSSRCNVRMREQTLATFAALMLFFFTASSSFASTIDVDASVGGTSISCCGNGLFTIQGYQTPLYTFQGGTVDFGTVVLSPYGKNVGPSIYQIFMGSVSSSSGPTDSIEPMLLYGDECVEGYGYDCKDLYFPSSITTPLVFTFPDNEMTQFQLVFLGSFDYIAPTATPLPSTWSMMLTILIGLGFCVPRMRPEAASSVPILAVHQQCSIVERRTVAPLISKSNRTEHSTRIPRMTC